MVQNQTKLNQGVNFQIIQSRLKIRWAALDQRKVGIKVRCKIILKNLFTIFEREIIVLDYQILKKKIMKKILFNFLVSS